MRVSCQKSFDTRARRSSISCCKRPCRSQIHSSSHSCCWSISPIC